MAGKGKMVINKLYDFECNNNRIEVSVVCPESMNATYLGVREFKKYDDGWRPTQNGFTLKESLVDELKDAVEKVIDLDPYLQEGDPVGVIKKGETEQLRVVPTQFKGKELLHIRSYFKSKKEGHEGEFVPSKVGMTLPPDVVDDLLEGLNIFLNREVV